MKKKILLIPLALLLAMSLVATGCPAPAPPVAPPPVAPPPVAPPPPPPPPPAPFPTKPVEVIVPWSAGGATDMTGRAFASVIPKYLGQALLVVNRPGGAAVPGTVDQMKAKPDGYTIGLNWHGSWALRMHILEVPYTLDDFEFLIGVVVEKPIIAVRADSPYQTLDDWIAAAKAKPGKLTYSTSGSVNWMHLTGEAFNKAAGIDTIHVPYDGGRPAAIALIGGHVDCYQGWLSEIAPEYEAGQARVFCVLAPERSRFGPEIPTARELGYDLSYPNRLFFVTPKGVPEDRLKILHDAIKKTLEDEVFLTLAEKLFLDIEYLPGDKLEAEVRAVYEAFGEIAPALIK